jgi:autotransporter-associated beta strand protein
MSFHGNSIAATRKPADVTTLSWDSDAGPPPFTTSGGTWSASAGQNWWTGEIDAASYSGISSPTLNAAGVYRAWTNSKSATSGRYVDAYFSGSAADITINVSGTVNVGSLSFAGGANYTTGAPSFTRTITGGQINFDSSACSISTVDLRGTCNINSALSGAPTYIFIESADSNNLSVFGFGGTNTMTMNPDQPGSNLDFYGCKIRANAANVFNNTFVFGFLTDWNATDSVFDLNGYNQSVHSLTGGQDMQYGARGRVISSTAATLTLGGDGTYEHDYGGFISGAVSIVKQGANTQIFSGAVSYTGSTSITGGVLRLNTPPIAYFITSISLSPAFFVTIFTPTNVTVDAYDNIPFVGEWYQVLNGPTVQTYSESAFYYLNGRPRAVMTYNSANSRLTCIFRCTSSMVQECQATYTGCTLATDGRYYKCVPIPGGQ